VITNPIIEDTRKYSSEFKKKARTLLVKQMVSKYPAVQNKIDEKINTFQQ
jgi:hypothetical protein